MNAPSSSLASTLAQTAARVAGGQQYPAGALYVVATPIGNLADFSLRAVHVLALVDAVACEDTRVTGGLMRHLGLDKPLIPLHEHNERAAAERVLARLAAGERVAYVSDAGTPAVSDPGAVLVAQARAAGHRVLPIPGASSVVTALSAAGHAAGDGGPAGFHFAGFLPAKGSERLGALDGALAQPCACVLFEAPHRVATLFGQLAERAPARSVTICRELTKQFEQIETLDAAALPAWLAADPVRAKGEFVLVLHAAAALAAAEDEVGEAAQRSLAVLLRELPLKQAVALAAEISGAPRNALYARALAWKQEQGG